MITNDIAPVIVNGCRPDSLKITHEGTCQARVQITARATETATGDCSSNQLVWWYDLDINNNGTVDFAQVPGNSGETFAGSDAATNLTGKRDGLYSKSGLGFGRSD